MLTWEQIRNRAPVKPSTFRLAHRNSKLYGSNVKAAKIHICDPCLHGFHGSCDVAPVQSISLELKSCENCRHAFLRRPTSVQVFCNPCRSMYQEECAQLQACVECGTERKYGDQCPDESRGRKLYCVHCVRVTEHAFSRLSSRTVQ